MRARLPAPRLLRGVSDSLWRRWRRSMGGQARRRAAALPDRPETPLATAPGKETCPQPGNEGRTPDAAGSRSVVPLGLAIVRGVSMRPTLAPGDRLLVRHGRAPRPGQIVVGRFADGTVAVKRAAEQRAGGWWLLSDNPTDGVDSRHRGVVPEEGVVGVVLARLWPRPRRL